MKNSSDVWFCSFLLHKGHEIKSYKVITHGKVCCFFDIDDNAWKQLKLEFNKSEISAYKSLIEKIKDLAF